MHVLPLGVLVAASAVSAGFTPYSKCGALVDVDVNNCQTLPCVLQDGKPVNMHVDFKAVWPMVKITSTIYGLIDNIPIFQHQDDQVCLGLLEGQCPVSTDQSLAYGTNFTVPGTMPHLHATLEWQIKDQDDQLVLCAQIPVHFTS